MARLEIVIVQSDGGPARGVIRVVSAGSDDADWARIARLHGSHTSCSGDDALGAVLDCLDTLGSRVAFALDQAIMF